ncbi:MAG: SEC-C metal-binding domain-containing protein [Lachnospiraceae bacterium]
MTRCWDYKGHMASEVTRNAMSVGLGRKIYPNEPCLCGSGKKYKRCCGRKG